MRFVFPVIAVISLLACDPAIEPPSYDPIASRARPGSVTGSFAVDIRAIYPEVPNPEWIALQILDGDATFLEAIANGNLGRLAGDPHATHVAEAS